MTDAVIDGKYGTKFIYNLYTSSNKYEMTDAVIDGKYGTKFKGNHAKSTRLVSSCKPDKITNYNRRKS